MPLTELANGRRRSSENNIGSRPYEVRIDSSRRGAFADLREAISSARMVKQEHPSSLIVVTDRVTGQLVIEVDF